MQTSSSTLATINGLIDIIEPFADISFYLDFSARMDIIKKAKLYAKRTKDATDETEMILTRTMYFKEDDEFRGYAIRKRLNLTLKHYIAFIICVDYFLMDYATTKKVLSII